MNYSEFHMTPAEGMRRAKMNLEGRSGLDEYEGVVDCYGRRMPTSVAEVTMHTHKREPGEVVSNAKIVGIDLSAQVARITGLK